MLATPSERGTRADLVRYSRLIYDKGWVANHDGNLSARTRPDRIVATPTSVSKGDVDEEGLVVVDARGEQTAGRRRIFSEIALHLVVYDGRDDVAAVVHAHPPYATAMACAGVGLDTPFMPEAVVSIGDRVPLVPFGAPRTREFTANLTPFVAVYDAVLLEGHGVLAWGDDLEQAFLRLELVEHMAKIATLAQPWGGVRALPDEVVGQMLQARRRAGLGPDARGVEPRTQVAARTPSRAVSAPSPARTPGGVGREELVRIIAEELGALLKQGSQGS